MKPQYVLPFERPIVELEEQLAKLESQPGPTPTTLESTRNMRVEIAKLKRDVFENLNPWETVQVARHQDRPQARDYIDLICDEFIELHGDRAFGDDRMPVWLCPSGRVPQSAAEDAVGGKIPSSHRLSD